MAWPKSQTFQEHPWGALLPFQGKDTIQVGAASRERRKDTVRFNLIKVGKSKKTG